MEADQPRRSCSRNPRHPYTEALFEALPEKAADDSGRLYNIPGQPPDLTKPPAGVHYTFPTLVQHNVQLTSCAEPEQSYNIISVQQLSPDITMPMRDRTAFLALHTTQHCTRVQVLLSRN